MECVSHDNGHKSVIIIFRLMNIMCYYLKDVY